MIPPGQKISVFLRDREPAEGIDKTDFLIFSCEVWWVMLKNKTKKELMEIAEEMGITLDPKMLKKTMIEIIETHAQGTGNSLREAIKNDLLDQLERDGVVGEFYVDLVNDYMALWDVKINFIKYIQ